MVQISTRRRSQIPTPTYNLAKFLNQLLTPFIPTQHSYVSSKDFLDSINDAPARGIISSLDVESLFTNVPIIRTINYICDTIYRTGPSPKLDIPEIHLRRLLEICTMETAFRCPRGNLYQQVDDMSASLHMELLEKKLINHTIPNDSKWLCYVDDFLYITQKTIGIHDLQKKNKNKKKPGTDDKIQFTVEDINGQLPFLDTVIIRSGDSGRFMVYRKPTNKNQYIHFFRAHDDRKISGVVIGFYLRALLICSEEYLTEELNYITAAFKKLKYPEGMLRSSLRKATNIKNRKANTEKPDLRFIVVPDSGFSRTLSRILRPSGLVVVNDTGEKIGHLVGKNTKPLLDTSIVYKIPCNGCDSAYFGETQSTDKKNTKRTLDTTVRQTPS
ncbi:uncharacterized protein LOC143029758 [Oratosquilla oratoria]|uniref:uncharacterized protein LOC143029758 n=1 Tax=Oratosquilla oratoria TaxID=337810 RepID=UPI003F764A54